MSSRTVEKLRQQIMRVPDETLLQIVLLRSLLKLILHIDEDIDIHACTDRHRHAHVCVCLTIFI